MYALIIVIGMLSPATGSVVPVGVTSQIVGKFKNVDQCKTAASQPITGGTISDLSLSRGGLLVLCIHGRKVISPNLAARLG
jgi:hypothetical protein